jgi:hypothetical protein
MISALAKLADLVFSLMVGQHLRRRRKSRYYLFRNSRTKSSNCAVAEQTSFSICQHKEK